MEVDATVAFTVSGAQVQDPLLSSLGDDQVIATALSMTLLRYHPEYYRNDS